MKLKKGDMGLGFPLSLAVLPEEGHLMSFQTIFTRLLKAVYL